MNRQMMTWIMRDWCQLPLDEYYPCSFFQTHGVEFSTVFIFKAAPSWWINVAGEWRIRAIRRMHLHTPSTFLYVAGRLHFLHIQNVNVRNCRRNWLPVMRKYAALNRLCPATSNKGLCLWTRWRHRPSPFPCQYHHASGNFCIRLCDDSVGERFE